MKYASNIYSSTIDEKLQLGAALDEKDIIVIKKNGL